MSGKNEKWEPVTAAERREMDRRVANNEMIPGGVRMRVDGTGIHFEKLKDAEIPDQNSGGETPPTS